MNNYELQARFKAGLFLSGQDEDGELEWMGTKFQFDDAKHMIDAFENRGIPILDQKFPF